MKKRFTSLCMMLLASAFTLCFPLSVNSQVVIDTLAIQDFETTPQPPVWTYTGTPAGFQSGFSSASTTPANSPLGIGGSRAWQTFSVSGGNAVVFDNQTIPSGYDSVRFSMRVAAFNLTGTTGGPDHLDYVLVEYSLNNGSTYVGRVRVRGASNNNCSWPYSAGSSAEVYYLPGSEQVFQPVNSGLQLAAGIGYVEITFPGTITQLQMRVTPRSSSSNDHWLIDNLVLTGEKTCTNSTGSLTTTACDSYTSPSGKVWTTSNTYLDTIPNSGGCDSVITFNLTVDNSSADSLVVAACNSYTSPTGKIWTSTNVYKDTINNMAGCDSIITFNLTINSSTLDSMLVDACDSYTAPSGAIYTNSGNYLDTISTQAGCDSVLWIDVTINSVTASATQAGNTLTATPAGASYQWIDCGNGNMAIAGATNVDFTPTQTGDYAVIVTDSNCADTSACYPVVITGVENGLAAGLAMWPNPATDVLHVSFGKKILNGNLEVYGLDGRTFVQKSIQNLVTTQVAMKELPAGIYFLRIATETGISVQKFIKQ